MIYKINITGTVENPKTGFRMGLDLSVENGGSVVQIGEAVQTAIDTCASYNKVEDQQ